VNHEERFTPLTVCDESIPANNGNRPTRPPNSQQNKIKEIMTEFPRNNYNTASKTEQRN